jgi:hypothetical protein
MSIASSPSLTGASRLFASQFNEFGGERFSVQFDDNTTSENFYYDGWVYRLSSESLVLQGGMQRADALCYTAFAGMITKFFDWNTKFVQYPRAGEAGSPVK